MCGHRQTKGYFYCLIVSSLSVPGPQPRHTSVLPPCLPTHRLRPARCQPGSHLLSLRGPWDRPGLRGEAGGEAGKGRGGHRSQAWETLPRGAPYNQQRQQPASS